MVSRNTIIILFREVFKKFPLLTEKRRSYYTVKILKAIELELGLIPPMFPPPPPYYSAVRAEVGPLAYLSPSLAGCTASQAEVCKNITRYV
jgi:hypothetical protein